jgi:uncharacterized membrane protein YkoI
MKGDENMKLNRWIALAAIALVVVAAMGALSSLVFGQALGDVPDAQSTCEPEGSGKTESDCDGDAGEPDDSPSGTPAITAEAARETAEAHLDAGSASEVELEQEHGRLVYSVEIGHTEVTVDAMTGDVLGVEDEDD